ncbi:MAG: tRNA (N(6)-L-threonylcarbamoyladenosine(37)-C(2))-methylthiotransferase MtaB [Dehalococcoidales bacterium]
MSAQGDGATRIALETLGCKLNQAETELMAGQLAEAGYRLVAASEPADVYILNTCTVTGTADAKSRHLLRMARRRHPGALLVATGCYAQRAAGVLAGIAGNGMVIGNERKEDMADLLAGAGYPGQPGGRAEEAAGLRGRTMVKIQNGCDSFCAYCVVPLVRPQKESRSAAEVIARIRQKVAGGHREAVLTGTEIGNYNDSGLGLRGLIQRILAETDVTRLRLSSLQPQQIDGSLLELWQDGRLCRHFHLALQSGSPEVLELMGRRYTIGDYGRAVALIRQTAPDAAITTDIIVGFPGETEAEFVEGLEFCREVGFARIHVFPYSLRPGTAAAGMPGQVPAGIKKQRRQQMLALTEESAARFRERYLRKVMPVLFEQKSRGLWSGLTDNYIRVYIKSDEDLTNSILPVKMERLYKDGVVGSISLPNTTEVSIWRREMSQ